MLGKNQRVLLICTEDIQPSTRELIEAAASKLEQNLVTPRKFSNEAPWYADYRRPDFVIVVVTPQLIKKYRQGKDWTSFGFSGYPVLDIMYIFDKGLPQNIPNGPWYDRDNIYFMFNEPESSDDDPLSKLTATLIEFLTFCDRCGKIWRRGSQIINLRTGETRKAYCNNCDIELMVIDYNTNNMLSTHLNILFAANSSNLRRILASYNVDPNKILHDFEDISEQLRIFERAVWLEGGVRGYWLKSRVHGHSLKLGNIEVLMWGSAGRVMFTFKNSENGHTVTGICGDEISDSGMGLQGIYATRGEAISMIKIVIYMFSQKPKPFFRTNNKVGPF